jgi:hypothetical protein
MFAHFVQSKDLAMNVPAQWWMSFRGCDSNLTSQRNLKEAADGPVHMFPDVFNLLPSHCVNQLQQMKPRDGDNVQGRAAAHTRQRDFLLADRSILEPGKLGRGCLKHGSCECPVVWQPPADTEGNCQPLTVNFSGPTCLPWSGMGKHEDMAHCSMASFHAWLAHVAAGHYDVVFLENAPGFKFRHFQRPMSKRYTVLKILFRSEDRQPSRHLCQQSVDNNM